jgi:hypothetical protein
MAEAMSYATAMMITRKTTRFTRGVAGACAV